MTMLAHDAAPVAVNLIPTRVRDAAIIRRRTRRWLVYGAVYAAAVAGACVVLQMVGGQEASRLSNDNGLLAARVADAQQQLGAIRHDVQEHARKKEASETVGVHPDWSLLLAALAETRQQDIILQSIDLKAVEVEKPAGPAKKPAEGEKAKAKPRHIESYLVDLKGYGLSQGDVVRFIGRLEDRGPLADVRLKESRSQLYRGVPAVAFTAQFRLTEGAAPLPTAPARADAETKP